MSDDLFQRAYSLTVGTLKITGLRVVFNVKKGLGKDPNVAEIQIFNLSPMSRKAVQEKGAPLILTAGYPKTEAVIFSGDVRLVDHQRDGASWVTKIRSGDGENAFAFSKFSGSYKAGTPIASVVRDVARALSINPGNLEDALGKPYRKGLSVFRNGYAAHGSASDVLDRLLKSLGFTYSIQGGTLQVLQGGAPIQTSAVLLTPSTGLIGSLEIAAPEKTGEPPRVKAKSLLQPQIVCGGPFELRTEGIKGQFRAESVEHSGDSHGAEWYTQIEAKIV